MRNTSKEFEHNNYSCVPRDMIVIELHSSDKLKSVKYLTEDDICYRLINLYV